MTEHFNTRLLATDEAAVALAARLLRDGQAVGMPTETVYGLAANALDEDAVKRIFIAKGRPQDNPLIVHIADIEMLQQVAEPNDEAMHLAEAFWPGPLTMVLPKKDCIASAVSAGLDTVGVRLPAHPVARQLIQKAGIPLAAPSANRSGSPSPTSAAHVWQDMQGRIPLILDGGEAPVGIESTVLSLVGVPTVLRPGFVTAQEIAQVLGRHVMLANAVERELTPEESPASPGMKYKHYAPRAEVILVNADTDEYIEYVNSYAGERSVYALCYDEDEAQLTLPCVCFGPGNDPVAQAAALFGALRCLDEKGAKRAYARMPQGGGVGLAVRNRLLRAAAFRVVRPGQDEGGVARC